jgi:seryl-tRNA(Sec) selenium transferase
MAMFKFELNQEVKIFRSNESGVIIGRAEYVSGLNNYFVRYVAADGRAVEAWWQEDALS